MLLAAFLFGRNTTATWWLLLPCSHRSAHIHILIYLLTHPN
jgi:hypothetical protein